MVLRKAMPPDVDHEVGQGEEYLPYPTSPTSSAIYSAETREFSSDPSPPSAFSIKPLNETETPHPGITSQEGDNPWAQEAMDKPDNDRPSYRHQFNMRENNFPAGEGASNSHVPLTHPETHNMEPSASPAIDRKQYGAGQDQIASDQTAPYASQLQSNNPFLKAKQQNTTPQYSEPPEQDQTSPNYGEAVSSGHGQYQDGDNLAQFTSNISLTDDQFPTPSYSQPPPPSVHDTQATPWPPSIFNAPTPTQPQNDGVSMMPPEDVNDSRTPVWGQDVSEQQRPGVDTNVPLINIEAATPSSSHDLLELTENHTSNTYSNDSQGSREPEVLPSEHHVRSDDIPAYEQQPNTPQNPADSRPTESVTHTPEPPRPQSATAGPSEAELARARKKRSETYDIRHVNWTDRTGILRDSPILVQNKNGPCPLLALVNGLVLRSDPDTMTPIVRALRVREKISLGLLTEALFDELTSCHKAEDQLPDIEALSNFLLMLHTGMNVNPRLTTEHDSPGKFLETSDINLYSTFKVPLVHGWLAPPSTPEQTALSRVAQYHEDIQLLHFRKEDLINRVFSGGNLTKEEEQTVADIDTIQCFVDVENATQLSAFGLDHLERTLLPGSVSILFRNDHFSTLYKHPDSNQLFTLVTDAGYASHAEIVWESLVDVNGSNAELFSGDFRPVGHAPAASRRQPRATTPERMMNGDQHVVEPTTAPTLPQDEQADADYAYALSLQFQDEEAQRESARNSRQGASHNSSGPHQSSQPSGSPARNRSSTSSTAHRNQNSVSSRSGRRQSSQTQNVRPLVPPRVGSATDPTTTTNHPIEDDADAPPPTYEQAARGPVYKPPPGHPQYDGAADRPNERSSTRRRSNGVDHVPQSPSPGHGYHASGHSPMGRRPAGATVMSAAQERQRERERNKDCIVM